MTYKIDTISKDEFPELVAVWEASVRATHLFLKEEDIAYFRPLILNTYLHAVELRCVRNAENQIIGFSGVAEQNLEMLFIHPHERGNGVGRTLLVNAIDEFNVNKVDVNEDNPQAVGFYEKFGFTTYKRSALDASGKPYPILHMKLKEKH
jgi:putative acetyltransferase